MDFFERKDDAESRSRAFYRAFGLAVVLAVCVFYFVVTVCLMLLCGQMHGLVEYGLAEGMIRQLPQFIYGSPPKVLALRPFLIISTLITAFILLVAWLKTRAIKNGGGAYIAEALGGREILEPGNSNERQLVNVALEMAVAAGLPRPRIYVLPHEMTINAVTAGLDHDDAVIAVTAGALNILSREELQGVVAHEFAHILNGDCALNLTMAGWLYGLLIFSVQGKEMINTAMDDMLSLDEGGRTGPLFYFGIVLAAVGLILWVGGWLGKFAAEILQAAFSRQREHLADAFAVQFTRNPEGLAGALKKIAGLSQHGALKSAQALMMNSFFIVSPNKATGGEAVEAVFGRLGGRPSSSAWRAIRPSRQGWRQSHPPLEDRILALEPGWDGSIPEIDQSKLTAPDPNQKLRRSSLDEVVVPQSAQKLLAKMDQALVGGSEALILALLAAGGGPRQATGFWTADSMEAEAAGRSLSRARDLFAEIPEKLRVAVDDPTQVAAVVAAVFYHEENGLAEAQTKQIVKFLGQETAERAAEFKTLLCPEWGNAPPQGDSTGDVRPGTGLNSHSPTDHLRLPLLGLASPTLKRLGPPERQKLALAVKALVAADGKLDLFELAACQVLKKPLGANFFASGQTATSVSNYMTMLQEDTVVVLSALAHLGTGDLDEARRAFAAGLAHFNHWPPYDILSRRQVSSLELARALDRFNQVPEKIKHRLILAAVSTALYTQQITEREYQLLRALAAALDVPLPLLANTDLGGPAEH